MGIKFILVEARKYNFRFYSACLAAAAGIVHLAEIKPFKKPFKFKAANKRYFTQYARAYVINQSRLQKWEL